MSILLVRPYPVERLDAVRAAIYEGGLGDLSSIHSLYVEACEALETIDPDEVREHVLAHTQAGDLDKAALRAAADVHATWEGVVSVGASIVPDRRFRGFALAAAYHRYIATNKPDMRMMKAWRGGGNLPGLSPEDTALFAALPMMMGLGPELPDEIEGPCPVVGEPVWRSLGLLEGDWHGVDPVDGVAISAETCKGAYSAATGPWRDALGRGIPQGLLVRPADTP